MVYPVKNNGLLTFLGLQMFSDNMISVVTVIHCIISIIHVYGGDCDTVSIIYTSVVVTVIRYLTPLFCMAPPSCISLLLYLQ